VKCRAIYEKIPHEDRNPAVLSSSCATAPGKREDGVYRIISLRDKCKSVSQSR